MWLVTLDTEYGQWTGVNLNAGGNHINKKLKNFQTIYN